MFVYNFELKTMTMLCENIVHVLSMHVNSGKYFEWVWSVGVVILIGIYSSLVGIVQSGVQRGHQHN